MGCMALLHVRAFILGISHFSKLGIVNTSTEIYSLVLAYLAGSYSVAGVLFLRCQLPLRRRKAVTMALGEDIVLDFYFWLFDVVFICSALTTFALCLLDIQRKRRLRCLVIDANELAAARKDRNYNYFASDEESPPPTGCQTVCVPFLSCTGCV